MSRVAASAKKEKAPSPEGLFFTKLLYTMASTAIISFLYGAVLVAGGLMGYAKVCSSSLIVSTSLYLLVKETRMVLIWGLKS